MDLELKDSVAIVTGGGQGLGRAYCLGFAEQGARVAVVDVNAEKAQAVAAEAAELGAAKAIAVSTDVSSEEAVAAMVATVKSELGSPTALVNNAGLLSTLGLKTTAELSVEEWDRVMAVNLRGTWLCIRAVTPSMAEQGYGKIVNISSSTAWWGRQGYPHYVSSKSAMIGLTRSMATEFGPEGIRVNLVAPGLTVTEINRGTVPDGLTDEVAEQTALKRVLDTADLVGPVLFLCSRGSDGITGQSLVVDGGDVFN